MDAFRVFIASPGGLDAERKAIREEIERFNSDFMHEDNIVFSFQGWEDVPGGAHRPQDMINELLVSCDYLILILGPRWGTQPAIETRFTSGTEEEFYLAEDYLNRDTSPMRDILVLFKGVPEEQLSDPGEQLLKVIAFKKLLEENKRFFYKTFDDLIGLRREIAARLRGWARDRSAKKPEVQSEYGEGQKNLLPHSPPEQGSPDSLDEVPMGSSALASAERLEAQGLMTQAEAAYARAIVDSDVVSLEKYARFLRRTGRLSRALEIDRRILSQLASLENTTETAAQRARLLTSIGIVQRKLGDLRASRYSLHEAVETARGAGQEALDVLAYSLDNLGLTASRSGDRGEAAECFGKALSVREGTGDTVGQARSLTNLCRLHKRSGDLTTAKEACSTAITLLEGIDDRTALASAHAAMGEILELESDLVGAEDFYRRALSMNEALGMPDNIAMSLNQVARVLVDRGEFVDAERYAQRSLVENERSSNREGTVSSTHLLGRIFGLTDREGLAISLLEEAVAAYAKMGNQNGEAWARFHLAGVLRRVERHAEASANLAKARYLAVAAGNAQIQELTALPGPDIS